MKLLLGSGRVSGCHCLCFVWSFASICIDRKVRPCGYGTRWRKEVDLIFVILTLKNGKVEDLDSIVIAKAPTLWMGTLS